MLFVEQRAQQSGGLDVAIPVREAARVAQHVVATVGAGAERQEDQPLRVIGGGGAWRVGPLDRFIVAYRVELAPSPCRGEVAALVADAPLLQVLHTIGAFMEVMHGVLRDTMSPTYHHRG